MKKVISVLLVAVLLLAQFIVPTFAATTVKSITAVANSPLREDWDTYVGLYPLDYNSSIQCRMYDIEKADIVFTVTMSDGKVYKGDAYEIYDQTGVEIYYYNDQYENPFVVGNNTVYFIYGEDGFFTCDIEVTENLYNGIEISGENELFITFLGKNSKDTYTTKVVDIIGIVDATSNDRLELLIETDDGETYVATYFYTYDSQFGPLYFSNVRLEIGGYYSNFLAENYWLMARLAMEGFLAYASVYCLETDELYGLDFTELDVEKDMLDVNAMVAIATYICDTDTSDYDDEFIYHTINIETAQNFVLSVFGVEDIDVTESVFLDEVSGDIHVMEPIDVSAYYETQPMTYADNKWTMGAELFDENDDKLGDVEVSIGELGTITRIAFKDVNAKPAALLGDADGDGKVEAEDARIILQYVVGIVNKNFVFENADADGDGAISATDARWALQIVAGIRK